MNALSLFCLFALVSGCAHLRSSQNDSRDPSALSDARKTVKIEATAGNVQVNSDGEILFRGMKLQNTRFDFPVTINSQVESWIDYFTGRGRKNFERYLERSELFIPYIRPLLRQNGLPEDLVYLAMIESGFNNHARSHARAVGPWQFISATGKRYGLMVNWWVDERRDTRKSTLAAVEYLRDLYSIFQSWELAAAAYNAGEAKIARAIRRFGVKDFWVLARHKFLRPETRNYVPKIIAAAIVSKNRTQFGFPASAIQPAPGEAVAGDGEVVRVEKESDTAHDQPSQAESITALLKADDSDPDLDAYEDAPEADTVAAELGTSADLSPSPLENGATIEQATVAKPVPTPMVSKKGVVTGEQLAEFDVQSPADLLKIARAAGLSYHTVKSLNPELLRWCTPPTVSTYRVRLPASVKDKFLAAYNQPAFPRKVQFLAHKVRRGETLARIARRIGIKVDPIADLNGVSPRMPLRAGTKILLPMPNDRSRSLASLEVRDPPEHRRYRRYRRRHGRYYRVSYHRRAHARATQAERD
jgi:membrane-bound lytic murein transglycosylase D